MDLEIEKPNQSHNEPALPYAPEKFQFPIENTIETDMAKSGNRYTE